MCKLVLFTNTSKIKTKEFVDILMIINENMTTEQDGFGWAAIGQKGLMGERYVKPEDFDLRIANKVTLKDPIAKVQANTFGKFSKLKGPLLVHGRTSTNSVGLKNTHPFVNEEYTLVHNGVVQTVGHKFDKKTNCDTEDLLDVFTYKGITGVENHLRGYYAFGAIAKDGKLHIVRDDRASLYCAYIETIDSTIFATTKDLIQTLQKTMKWKVSPIDECLDNFYAVYDGNNLMSLEPIKPGKGSSDELESAARKAFSYQNTHWDDSSKEEYDPMQKYTYEDDPSIVFESELEYCEIFGFDHVEIRVEDYLALSKEDRKKCFVVNWHGTRVEVAQDLSKKVS